MSTTDSPPGLQEDLSDSYPDPTNLAARLMAYPRFAEKMPQLALLALQATDPSSPTSLHRTHCLLLTFTLDSMSHSRERVYEDLISHLRLERGEVLTIQGIRDATGMDADFGNRLRQGHKHVEKTKDGRFTWTLVARIVGPDGEVVKNGERVKEKGFHAVVWRPNEDQTSLEQLVQMCKYAGWHNLLNGFWEVIVKGPKGFTAVCLLVLALGFASIRADGNWCT